MKEEEGLSFFSSRSSHLLLSHRHQQHQQEKLTFSISADLFRPKKGRTSRDVRASSCLRHCAFRFSLFPWPSIHIISRRASCCLLLLLSSSTFAILVTFNKLFDCSVLWVCPMEGCVVAGWGCGWICAPRMVEKEHREERGREMDWAGLPCFTSLPLVLRISHLSCEDMKTRKRNRYSRGREEDRERESGQKKSAALLCSQGRLSDLFLFPSLHSVQRPFILSAHLHTCITQHTIHSYSHSHSHTENSKKQDTKHKAHKKHTVSPSNSTLPALCGKRECLIGVGWERIEQKKGSV